MLPFLYLSVGQNEEAKKYFEFLLQLGYRPPIESSYFKSLFLTKYNPTIYRNYIKNINKDLEKNLVTSFEFNSNPFNPEKSSKYMENMFLSLFDKINKSFTCKINL
jgi:hypothetical protein